MGPRGNYIQAGRGGFYYRATLPSARPNRLSSPSSAPSRSTSTHEPHRPTVGPEQEIESGSVLEMRDDSATGVLAELNEKRRRWRRAPLVFVLAIALFVASSGAPGALQVA